MSSNEKPEGEGTQNKMNSKKESSNELGEEIITY